MFLVSKIGDPLIGLASGLLAFVSVFSIYLQLQGNDVS